MSDDELDDSWITDIENEEKTYNDFYKEENEAVEIVFVYINKENKIYYVRKENILLVGKKLDKIQLIFLLKKNKIYNETKHKLISILQYNIDLSPEELGLYLKNNERFLFDLKNNQLSLLSFSAT